MKQYRGKKLIGAIAIWSAAASVIPTVMATAMPQAWSGQPTAPISVATHPVRPGAAVVERPTKLSFVDEKTGNGVIPAADFGTVTVGSFSRVAFMVKNSGKSAPLYISGITLSGDADFQMFQNGCPMKPAALAGGTSCAFTVEFKPQMAGHAEARVTIIGNADAGPHTIALRGTGE
jgi:HYDIN/CFA65/VesB-like, Ig-like domain